MAALLAEAEDDPDETLDLLFDRSRPASISSTPFAGYGGARSWLMGKRRRNDQDPARLRRIEILQIRGALWRAADFDGEDEVVLANI
jgi:hypothetical protein